tara:strand:- start:175 stop:420 length:246 start_codon:yes stop_codon:yes gene_type:complete
MSKIFVGNLDYKLSTEELEEFFAECGEVTEAKIIKDYETGRSKGFGFVTFADETSVQSAVEKNGAPLNDREVRVSVARERN